MPKRSAGLVLFRRRADALEILLVHPGGPFYARKDAGVWSIPKGEYEDGADPQAVSLREFEEETGTRPEGTPFRIGEVRQAGGKLVTAFALAGDLDATTIRSNLFTTEWPPRSGRMQSFPEVDRAAWFTLPEARRSMLPSQIPLIDLLQNALAASCVKISGH